MCGIAGLLHLDGAPPDAQALSAMTHTLAHRGPDGQGVHVDGPCGLGHRRLSIVDLSSHGAQPMSNEDGTLWVTFNGEIFNHAELRADLLADGHCFVSQTDTESILHGYEALGREVLGRFNGMFAFALWDARQQSLWLVRDRLGVKPLFYGVFCQTLLFGSEIKALLVHPACTRRLDPIALDFYLSLNYIPAPYTLFEGIRQVQPAEWVLAQVGSSTLEKQTYWHIPYGQTLRLSLPQAEEEFRARLGEAVRKRLMADVPLGAFLSGGLDSSAVVAFMRDYAQERVKTFSIGFAERSFDEAPFARLVAEHLGTDHHAQNVSPQVAEVLPKLVWHAEDPLADSSMLPVYYLSQMTRQHVTVALAGDGDLSGQPCRASLCYFAPPPPGDHVADFGADFAPFGR